MVKRVFLVVADSLGIGALPDAADFGDAGAHTFKHITKSPFFKDETLGRMGIYNIDGQDYGTAAEDPCSAHARMGERSKGKDTTVGHWEIAGLVSEKPFPTYPNGFPEEVIKEFSEKTGREILCNKTYSGTEVIKDYGREHVETGKLIVYTSADSVFQIAAHEDVVPLSELYEYCRIAREMLKGEHGVGRVIARPFISENGEFIRTANRRDFSLEPYGRTMLDVLKEKGLDVIAVGKITDIFAGRGMTESIATHGNKEGMEITSELLERDFTGLCFTNLVDFDMLYGHRNDIDGYAGAVAELDNWLKGFINCMREDDILMLTADHGCDPSDVSTDHTREYAPLLVYGKNVFPKNLGTRESFADIGATVCELFGAELDTEGKSFAKEIFDL